MSAHALLSPSSAHRWLSCPGSVAMESQFPRTTSSAAEYGTACHELAAWALTDNDHICFAYLARKTTNGQLITREMAELVQIYVNNVLQYVQNHTLMVEQRVDFSNYIGVPESFGTADHIIITNDGEEIIIGDLKTGYHFVTAEENPQLMLYALGALHEFGMLGSFKRVRLVIHQPSQNHLDEWDCTVEELLAFAAKAKQGAQNAVDLIDWPHEVKIEDYLHPEEKACQYCKAASICPALANHVAATIGADFENLTDKTDVIALVSKEPDVLSQKMAATTLIENWIRAVRAEVERILFAGERVPGYKLVQGKMGNRKWVDEQEVIRVFKAIKLPKEQMYNSSLISPTDAEKLLKVAPEKWAKLENFITRAQGALSVAPRADKRAEVWTMKPIDGFQDLTGTDLI